MKKQKLINKYFKKICSDKFLKDDDEEIIGKVKDVLQNIKEQMEYIKDPKNKVEDETIELITNEANELIEQINDNHPNKEDVIMLYAHPMAGFYTLCDNSELLEELQEYNN